MRASLSFGKAHQAPDTTHPFFDGLRSLPNKNHLLSSDDLQSVDFPNPINVLLTVFAKQLLTTF
jgi:hypothetical protein